MVLACIIECIVVPTQIQGTMIQDMMGAEVGVGMWRA